jgi:hypothetical protein
MTYLEEIFLRIIKATKDKTIKKILEDEKKSLNEERLKIAKKTLYIFECFFERISYTQRWNDIDCDSKFYYVELNDFKNIYPYYWRIKKTNTKIIKVVESLNESEKIINEKIRQLEN